MKYYLSFLDYEDYGYHKEIEVGDPDVLPTDAMDKEAIAQATNLLCQWAKHFQQSPCFVKLIDELGNQLDV